MNNDNYSKSEIDLKFSTLEDKMASKFELLNQKWDASVQQILSQTKVLLKENNHALVHRLNPISHWSSNFDYP